MPKTPGEIRRAELKARLRANGARHMWPETIGRLGRTLGVGVAGHRQLDPARADALVSCADERSQRKDAVLIVRPPSEAAEIWELTNSMAANLKRTHAILLVTASGVHIGVELDARLALRRASELVKTFNVFRLMSDECEDGLVADYSNIGYGDDTEYMLAAWGMFADAAPGTTSS